MEVWVHFECENLENFLERVVPFIDNKQEDIDQRKANVIRHIRSIVNDMCSGVVNNYKRQMQAC